MSFDIALSGIHAINEQLETVSNNIANAATYGFKSTRANFASVYAGADASGVEIASTTQNINKNGSTQMTGRSLDASINGRGFFVSRDDKGSTSYTRVGIFSTDAKGFLVDSNGGHVQGYAPSKSGALGPMGDLQVPTGQIPASQTTTVTFVGNMSAGWEKPAVGIDKDDTSTYNMVKQSIVYDSIGVQHTLSQYFVKQDDTKVDVYYSLDGGALPSTGTPPVATPSTTLVFGSDGQLVPPATGTKTVQTLSVPAAGGAAKMDVTIDYTGTTRFAGEATSTTNRSDGYASGIFVGVELAKDGSLVARYSNDQSQVVGTLALATFANEGGLSPTSGTTWIANAESGAALYNAPGQGLSGKLSTGSLEGSNVDITSELVGLMTSQRNYQANSKVLSTESAMMQALMQAL
jgi:flagellar hook protein FlgE